MPKWHSTLPAKSSTALIYSSPTPRNLQNNRAGQHFWPDLFLGRWLTGVSRCLREISADHEAVGWECPRGSVGWVCVGEESGSLEFSRWSRILSLADSLMANDSTQQKPHQSTSAECSLPFIFALVDCIARRVQFPLSEWREDDRPAGCCNVKSAVSSLVGAVHPKDLSMPCHQGPSPPIRRTFEVNAGFMAKAFSMSR